MTMRLLPLPTTGYEVATEGAGLGALATGRGNLPLETVDVAAAITGLTARVVLSQGFRNPHDVPLEATYIFPLPDRAAVTAMRMEADGRIVDGVLKERGEARADYQQAISEGRRASIAEEERPDVFTMRVGNIAPGEVVTVRLTLDQPLPYADGAATFRFPLVVAPRYVPGAALPGEQVGSGWSRDTASTPDASRISPPVLLPGFPNPVALSIGVDIDPGGLPLSGVRSSLHAVRTDTPDERDAGPTHLSIEPGERADRDFALRLDYGRPDAATQALVLAQDAGDADSTEGTFQLTVLPPTAAGPARPRDVVLVLDRSGSMGGWKMVAARRAAARIVDTLTDRDRFAVLAFDNTVERPAGLPQGLVAGTDRNRYRAVEHLARTEARGGTEMLGPLAEAAGLLTDEGHDRVLVLVTDGQVGNEDELLATLSGALSGIRVHTIGIDRAVNAGFLTRLAVVGGGRCELVESEDRLDEAADHIHRRICTPLVTDLRLTGGADSGFTVLDGTVAPARLPALFPGVPLVISGRWRGAPAGAVALAGQDAAGGQWSATVRADGPATAPAVGPVWARAHLRDLEDGYLVAGPGATGELERRIVATSLRFGVLCRFTAYVAIDSRVVTDGGAPHQITQPVEPASGWDMLAGGPPVPLAARATAFGGAAMRGSVADLDGAFAMDEFRRESAAPIGMARPAPGAPPPPVAPAQWPTSAPAPAPSSAVGGGGGQAGMKRAGRGRAADDVPTPVDPLAWARAQAADEVRRLHAAGVLTSADRVQLLVDLGNRLHAMVVALARQGVPADDPGPIVLGGPAGGAGPELPGGPAGPGMPTIDSWPAGVSGVSWPSRHASELRRLADALQAADAGNADELWRRAVTVLTAFAGAVELPARTPGPPVRRTFWKR